MAARASVPARGPHHPGTRRSRYHTARGPMSLSGWLRLPAARLRARLGSVPERPWIVPAAVGWLRRRTHRGWSVLELGAGRSTPWLAKRVAHLITLEDNEHWYRQTAERLRRAGLGVDLRLMAVEEFSTTVSSLPDAHFDLVVIDFLESPGADRIEALRSAKPKVKPGGHLLLDDSDRPGYAAAPAILSGWSERRFVGVKDEFPQVCETTVFRRPR